MAFFKRARVGEELERMIAEARRKGLPAESVESIYQGTPEQIAEHERRNGYDKPWGPKGVAQLQDDDKTRLDGVQEGQQIFFIQEQESRCACTPGALVTCTFDRVMYMYAVVLSGKYGLQEKHFSQPGLLDENFACLLEL